MMLCLKVALTRFPNIKKVGHGVACENPFPNAFLQAWRVDQMPPDQSQQF